MTKTADFLENILSKSLDVVKAEMFPVPKVGKPIAAALGFRWHDWILTLSFQVILVMAFSGNRSFP